MKSLLLLAGLVTLAAASTMPSSGLGTATVYDTSSYVHGVGACNCRSGIAKYPTAALNELYFGKSSNQGAGPACGKCYRLTVIGDPYSPSWCPPSPRPTLVVKIADLCPAVPPNMDWCAATANTNNKFGVKAHFDLDEKSVTALTGGTSRRAFRIHYCEVHCSQWAGYNDGNANGQQSTVWGSCPQTPSSPGACTSAPSCGSSPAPAPSPTPAPTRAPAPAPAPTPSGGRPSFTWNKNSNEWWFAVRISPRPSSVAVDCGAGWKTLSNPSWDGNSWESNNHCTGTFKIRINGSVFNARVFDTADRYGEMELEQDENLEDDETENETETEADEEENGVSAGDLGLHNDEEDLLEAFFV